MTITPIVSFLAQSQLQAGRLSTLTSTAADLQRQLTTQKKTDTYSGLGTDAINVLRNRMSSNLLDTYSANTDAVSTRLKMMTDGIQQAQTSASSVMASIKTKIGSDDYVAINSISTQAVPLMRDIANLSVDGRYLFSGSSTTTEPLPSTSQANTTSQNLWNSWKAGTITSDQLLASLSAATPPQLGFDPALTSAGSVSVRVDTSHDVDYTSIASTNGIQGVYQVMSMLSQFTQPNPATDVPTDADTEKVMNGLIDLMQKGMDQLTTTGANLGTQYDTITALQTQHKTDSATLDALIGDKEDADTTEVAVQLQSLQTQLSASYQVTSMLSKLSLVNYL